MKSAGTIFRFLLDAQSRGERTALVTVTDIEGSSSRAPGTHMAISETGACSGSLSGGCVEAAVVAEAQRIMESGKAELVRFGAGSRYIDIRLPCGGGLDLLFLPDPPADILDAARQCLDARQPLSLVLTKEGTVTERPSTASDRTGWSGNMFIARHDPDLRLLIVGHGEETISLADQGHIFGAEICVLTPDDLVADTISRKGLTSRKLKTPNRSPDFCTDPDTAVVLLFHDHDWEPALLEQALESDAFFVGAMGSRRTHANRVEILRERGMAEEQIARLVAPIGLIPATRDPDTLGLSILSQVVAAHTIRTAERLRAD